MHLQGHHIPSLRTNGNGSRQARPRSRSSLNVPAHNRAHAIKHLSSVVYDQDGKISSFYPSLVTSEKRHVPRRESLTQWRAEREEMKAKLEGTQRATTEERVRRANELEQEREKELLAMGKGTAMGKKKEKEQRRKGCLGVIWALFGS